MEKKILVLGGTGALATYLVPTLVDMGYLVDVVSLDDVVSSHPRLTYTKFDVKNIELLSAQVAHGYNAIVDFMLYPSPEEFSRYYKLFLENTDHYIFLSTYRIYAESIPIVETSPRLLEASDDQRLLTSGDYCIYKAQEEDMLRASGHTNWTILRPAITYATRRFQLTTLEAEVLVWRMQRGLPVVLPEPALNIQASMSWSGDFAKLVSRLILNRTAFGETYTVSTSEHHTWGEIAEIYREIGGLKIVPADTESYLNIVGPGNIHARQQLIYDRYLNRAVDNTKILTATGLKQSDMMPLKKGLALEYATVKPDTFRCNVDVNRRMDEYLAGKLK